MLQFVEELRQKQVPLLIETIDQANVPDELFDVEIALLDAEQDISGLSYEADATNKSWSSLREKW